MNETYSAPLPRRWSRVFLLVVKSVRLARSSQAPLDAQALMVPLLGLLLHSMKEHFVFLDTAIPNVLFMIFAGFLFAHGAGERA